jgi:hypothetical protein
MRQGMWGKSSHFAVVGHGHAWAAARRAVAAGVEVRARVVFGLIHAASVIQVTRFKLPE